MNKEITEIQYFPNGMPSRITFGTGHYFAFKYDAGGTLLRKEYFNGTETNVTDYAGMIQYEDNTISFIWTPEGRAINTGASYDYEYFLKDHLGNTRVVFGMLDKTDVYTATMETELSSEESVDFTNLPSSPNPVYNHTASSYDVPVPNESAPVGGTYNPMGPAKYLAVGAGDKVDMEIWARYDYINPDANSLIVGDMAAAVLSGFGLVSGEAGYAALNSKTSAMSAGASPADASTPKSYMAYVLLSADKGTVEQFGLVSVDLSSNGGFAQLGLPTLNIVNSGHLYIYLANESLVTPVYFDDFRIVHQQNQKDLVVSQSMDYYPFGLPIEGTAYINEGQLINQHLYQGKEYRTEDGLNLYDFHARQYDPALGRFLAVDPAGQFSNPYLGMGNNPVVGVDPDGEFVTWSFSKDGFSIGLNFTPAGVPAGFGINVGWGDGFSMGAYTEVGPRVGGTGFGSGATINQSFDYNFKHMTWTGTTSESVYASFGSFNAGAGLSQTYSFEEKMWSRGWSVSAGVGFGDYESGVGFNIGYGSNGFTFGIGGYYDKNAWDDNPIYDPDGWNDDLEILYSNNCYSYALDDPLDHPLWGKPQPGDISEYTIPAFTLEDITKAAINDGLIKKPNILNKLGFGRNGYYEVYLVIDNHGKLQDYHWYRRDKGGLWSHKPGHGTVRRIDASGNFIKNPVNANHNYGSYNYSNGGILLWKKVID